MKLTNLILVLIFVLLNNTDGVAQCATDGHCPKPPNLNKTIGMYDVHIYNSDLCEWGIPYYDSWKLEREVVMHSKVRFIFDTNPVASEGTILVDFEDGKGWRELKDNSSFDIEYTNLNVGENHKTITIANFSPGVFLPIGEPVGSGFTESWIARDFWVKKSEFDENEYKHPDEVHKIEIGKNDYIFPGNNDAYKSGGRYSTPTAGIAYAYIWRAQGHGNLVKPVIFVEGLDLGETTFTDPDWAGTNGLKVVRHGSNGWENFICGLKEDRIPNDENEQFRFVPRSFKEFREKNYDIVFLDFGDGADYIQKNAALLEKLLNKINNELKKPDSDGKVHENVVIGASMGGLISRYTLAKMEKEGKNHCTSMYVSFDAPQKGANMPLSVQSAAWFAADAFCMPEVWNKLNAPAPRQMLIEHFGRAAVEGKIKISHVSGTFPIKKNLIDDYAVLKDNLFGELDNLGYPKRTRNIVLSCGSDDATFPDIQANSPLLVGHIHDSSAGRVFNIGLWASDKGSDTPPMHVTTSTQIVHNLDGKKIFGGGISNILYKPNTWINIPAIPVVARTAMVKGTDIPLLHLDSSPGSCRTDPYGFAERFKAIAIGIDQSFEIDAINNRFTFMPTQSVLDINKPLTNANMAVNFKNNKKQILESGETPFANWFAPKGENLQHVEMSEDMKDWTINEIEESGEEWLGNLTITYNYGRKKNVLTTMNIQNGGKLWVNHCGPTGYLNIPRTSPQPDYPIFHVHTAGCGAIINVKSSGILHIGEQCLLVGKPATGVLHISANGVVNIQGGGLLRLDNASVVSVERNGILTIEPNGNVQLFNDSKIIVLDGGTLTVKAGANININDFAQIVVEKGGKLIIEKGIDKVQFTGVGSNPNILVQGELVVNAPVKMNGTAYFDFVPGHKLTLLSTFDLTGENKARKMINLQKSTTLSLKSQDIVFANGGILYGSGTKIQMPSQKTVYFGSINFEASPDANIFTTGLTNQNSISPTSITINGCTFLNLAKDIELVHNDVSQSPASIDITGSAFTNYRKFGILLDKSLRMNVTGSSFSTASTNGGYQSGIELGLLGLPSNFPPAIIARDVPAIIDLSSCEVAGNDAAIFQEAYEAYMSDPSTIDNTHACKILFDDDASDANAILNGFNYAIYLQNVPHFYLTHGTTIHDAFTGIYARGKSNVIMRQGAALIKNGIGVNMIGQKYIDKNKPTAGLFFMDCSSLLENAIGVLGKNIVLATDEFVNSNNNNSNYFTNFVSEKDGIKGRYFDIIYSNVSPLNAYPYINNTIYTTNNYWSPSLPVQNDDYYIIQGDPVKCIPNIDYTLEANPSAKGIQADCSSLSGDDDPKLPDPFKQGKINTQTGTVSALPFAWSGISAMLNQNLDEMSAAFTPLAKVSDYERDNSENGYTQMYVDIAKAFVYAPSDDVPIEVDGRNAKVSDKSKSSVLVYPNPAHQWLTIELPTQNHRLQLADGLGRSVYNETVNGTTRLNVGQYPSGVYHVIVTDDKGVQTRSKVVVQHD